MNLLKALYIKDKKKAWTCLIADERYSNDRNLLTFDCFLIQSCREEGVVLPLVIPLKII